VWIPFLSQDELNSRLIIILYGQCEGCLPIPVGVIDVCSSGQELACELQVVLEQVPGEGSQLLRILIINLLRPQTQVVDYIIQVIAGCEGKRTVSLSILNGIDVGAPITDDFQSFKIVVLDGEEERRELRPDGILEVGLSFPLNEVLHTVQLI
jgi:hypothetical protein